jgi:two-component system sensor histidine kinase HydH
LRDREQVEEKRRREVERLADIGKAVSGLAHDIKTPLIGIGGICRLVQKGLKDDDPNRDRLNLAIEEVRRLENMIKEMLDFSRPLELHRSMEGIDRIVKESREIAAEFAREKKVEIKCASSGTLPLSSMDPMRMKQVVINLLMNAIEASPAEETVTIASYQKGRELIVEVLDHGQGISPDKKEEIFLPFFTTKSEGTGLGLPIAKKIIEAHQGRLELLDNACKGSTFRVAVPIE